MSSNKKLWQRTSLDTCRNVSTVTAALNKPRTLLLFVFLTSRTFCMVSGVMLKLTGMGTTLAFCGWILKGTQCKNKSYITNKSAFLTGWEFAHLTMHNELAVLTQIFGQQGAFQVTAEGVLRRKHKRQWSFLYLYQKPRNFCATFKW